MTQLIPNDYTRCDNSDCKNKEACKRFLQHQLDKAQKNNNAVYVATFKSDEICEKIIK